jgi:hypothetical protein
MAAPVPGVAYGQGTCTINGTAFTGMTASSGGVGIVDLAGALRGQGTLGSDQIGRSSVSIPVQGPSLPQSCTLGNRTFDHCTHAPSWNGTATFTLAERCSAVAGGGYACARVG